MKILLDHDVPDELSLLLGKRGHEITRLRDVLPDDSSDEAVLRFAHERRYTLLTCNREDSLHLGAAKPHHGLVINIRRRAGRDERAALFRLLEHAGETRLPE